MAWKRSYKSWKWKVVAQFGVLFKNNTEIFSGITSDQGILGDSLHSYFEALFVHLICGVPKSESLWPQDVFYYLVVRKSLFKVRLHDAIQTSESISLSTAMRSISSFPSWAQWKLSVGFHTLHDFIHEEDNWSLQTAWCSLPAMSETLTLKLF